MTSAAVTEAELSRHDVDASWADWACGADLADEPDVALALFAARPSDQDGPDELEGAAFDTARLELMAGRPERALHALAGAGLADLPAAPADDPRAALLAAARAATGDVQAYRWLLAGLRNTEWAGTWTAAYIVAAAAEASEDHDTADEMWSRIVATHGIRTRHALGRAAAAAVARRDRDDAAASTTALVDAAGLLDGVPLGVAADPDLALGVVRELLTRGDHAGAVLLLRALDRCTASHPRIAAELARLAPAGPRRRQQTLGGLVAGVPFVAAAGLGIAADLPALAVPVAIGSALAHQVWSDRCRLPGLDREASGAFRALGTLEHDTSDGIGRLQPVSDQRGAYAAAAVAALVPTGIVASQLTAVLGDVLAGLVWAVALVGALIGGYLAARAVHRGTVGRRRERRIAAAHRARARQLARCACSETPVVTGGFVAGFRRAHLVTVGPDNPLSAAVAGRLGAEADLAFCPTTGHLWLAPRRADGQDLLLRGVVATGVDPDDARPAGVLTGFYL